MTPQQVLTRLSTRRQFLLGAGLAAVAAACSNGSDGSDSAVEAGGTASTAASAAGGAGADPSVFGGVATGDLWAAQDPLRVPFGVLKQEEGGPVEVLGAPVTIGFTGPGGETIAPQAASFQGEGLQGMEHEGIYTVHVAFPATGFWDASIDVEGEEGTFAFEVREEPQNPAPGDEAVSTPSPTPDETLGVDPICTRTPECGLHDVSLDEALANGKPTVLMFSTPARCTSRWCGPVLEVMLAGLDDERRGAANVVHVEIFKNLQDNDPVPTVAEWGLTTEPILYGIDAEGIIRERIDGAFDQSELSALFDRIIA